MVEDALLNSGGGTLIRVEVIPGSKKVGFRYNEWRRVIEVRLKNPPKSGKANRELIELFSRLFGHARIEGGHTSRSKLVFVSAPKSEVAVRLRELIGSK